MKKIGLIAAAGALLTLAACATQVPTDNGACAAKCAPCAPSCKGCPSCKGACRSCGE
jgi:hypothetical protein